MIRRLLAVFGVVGLVGSFGWYLWPLDFAQSEQTAVPSPPPAETPVAAATPEPPPLQTETVELRSRDTLADLLKRNGLPLGQAGSEGTRAARPQDQGRFGLSALTAGPAALTRRRI